MECAFGLDEAAGFAIEEPSGGEASRLVVEAGSVVITERLLDAGCDPPVADAFGAAGATAAVSGSIASELLDPFCCGLFSCGFEG